MKYRSYGVHLVAALAAWILVAGAGYAAATDIANAPLASTSSDVVKPNVMFIIDDSGSMADDYSPDDANFSSGKYGPKTNHCNGMYYDPTVTYNPPVNADGTSFPNASFTAALPNGYLAATSGSQGSNNPTDLTNSVYYTYSGSTPNLGYAYDASGNLITTGTTTGATFYKECNSSVGSTPGSTVFQQVQITAQSTAALQTNFANWYSYYRTRMQMMKTAAGLAFKDIGSNYRVGYSTIGYSGTDSTSNDFQKIADFDATQKASFYSKLYKANPTHWTPLRAALSKAGQIYAGKLLTGADDPVQYSCQQNFTILSTDGYWNNNEETSTYGPYGLDGITAVGNQDATEIRPMYDGTVTSSVTYTTSTITFSATNATTNTSVASVSVNGTIITASGNTNYTQDPSRMASRVANKINGAGYSATVSGNVVTIKAPTSAGPITYTPVVSLAYGNMNYTATPFSSTTNTVTSGGASNTLADVAEYFYTTDLRTAALGNCVGALGAGIDVCANNVAGSGLDNKTSQHMTTFTLGLGVNGLLSYSEDYLSGGSADYNAISNGTKNWPDPVANNGPQRVDDLWHAAVNGRGTYFSAQTPSAMIRGISKALTGATVRTGSGAAAATSNLEPVAADNFLFLATYRTSFWDGDLQAKTIDPNTGQVSADASWSAQQTLDASVGATTDSRTIYTFDGSANATTKLKLFTWANLTTTEQAYFNAMCSPTVKLSQCNDTMSGPNLTSAQKDMLSGQNLLNFLRGQTGFEDQAGNTNPIYRDRVHVLGDMIGSQPVYVKVPPFAYLDANYSAFQSQQKNRAPVVYVAANDGMLHAFDATIGQTTSGTEIWAYIPPMVLPNLYKLADKGYASNHQYYVDGAPTVGDICPNAPASSCAANAWKSILVGGLNAGGNGYYALDITDPNNPKALWNFTSDNDADMGYSFGNPIITKRQDGTWVVVFSSGYNNHVNGDGKGHIYILNAYTGALLQKLDTTAGDTTTPSGLSKINAWVDSTTDNTAKRFYGGDLLGNVWRFDPDDRIAPVGNLVTLLAQLGNVSPAGVQPVTTKPELTEITEGGVKYAVVDVATGRYLGVSDLSDTSIQSIYAIKDNLSETGLGLVRTAGVLVKQTLTTSADGSTRTTSKNPVSWATTSGWYLDLNPNNESPGERVNVDMQQQLGLLTVAGNVPKNDACTPGGYAWIYSLDFKSGQYIEGATGNFAGRLSNGLVAGLKTLKLTTGKTITLVTDTGGKITVFGDPSSNPGSGNGARRVSWRELVTD